MFTLWFERQHKVLMAQVSGVLSSDDIDIHDRAVLRFLAGQTGVRAIYDFSAVDALAVPTSKIAQRGQRPAIVSERRVVVAPRQAGEEFARIIRDQQRAAGLPEPTIVPTLEEAYALLGLDYRAVFEPVDFGLSEPMIEYFFEYDRRVLMARITGIYDTEEMLRLDDVVEKIVARHGELRALYDFSAVEKVTVPMERLAERARAPSIVGGLRVLVAPQVVGLGMTRLFSERQSDAGQTAPMVVSRLEEAYVLLGLDYKARFEPVEVG